MTRARPLVRSVLLGLVGVLVLAALWEAYKALGPAEGWRIGEVSVLPRTTDLAMPHVWDMAARAFAPVRGGSDELVVQAVLAACLTTAATALAGLLVEHLVATAEREGNVAISFAGIVSERAWTSGDKSGVNRNVRVITWGYAPGRITVTRDQQPGAAEPAVDDETPF